MFNGMYGHVVNAFVKIGLFHAILVFFNDGKRSFDSSSQWFQLFVD